MTDMYESFKSVYFPTNAIETESKSRSWLQQKRAMSSSRLVWQDILGCYCLPATFQRRATLNHF